MAIQKGTQIKSYQIIELIGRGGMAEVYKARHVDLDSFVTIKMIRMERFPPEILPSVVKRFQNEAQKMAQLSHPNIVKVMDYGTYKGVPYFVMDYLPGGTLKEYLGKPMPYRQAAKLLLPIAEALAYAHSEGVIHRDVKPTNILIGKNGQPMLSDFGVAKLMDSEQTQGLTATGASIGTPEYMAPEQAMGEKIDQRVDVYSLGVIMYELVTGRRPFSAETPMKVVFKQMQEPLPDPSQYVKGLPVGLVQMLNTSLARDPKDRYGNMETFTLALKGLSAGKSQAVRKPIKRSPNVETKKKNKAQKDVSYRWLIGIGGMAVIGLLIYAGIKLVGGNGETNYLDEVSSTPTKEVALVEDTSMPLPTSTPQLTNSPQFTPTVTTDTFILAEENINKIQNLYTIPNVIKKKGIPYFSLKLPNRNFKSFISNSNDTNLIYSISNNQVEKTFDNVSSPYEFSLDDKYYAFNAGENLINIYRTENFELVKEMTVNPELENANITSIAFSPENTWLAVGVEDSLVRIYDMINWDFLIQLEDLTKESCGVGKYYGAASTSIGKILFSDDESYMLVQGECNAIVYETETWTPVFDLGKWDHDDRYEISINNDQVVIAENSSIKISNLGSDDPICEISYTDTTYIKELGDKYFLVSLGTLYSSERHSISLIDIENCQEIFYLNTSTFNSQSISGFLSYNEDLLFIQTDRPDQTKIFKTNDFAEIDITDLGEDFTRLSSLMNNGKYIISYSLDYDELVWGILEAQ